MSKQLGNSPDPIELIKKYSADGVRVGMLLTSPAGNDLPFDEALCEQGRNFANKIWNALRLVKGFSVDESLAQPAPSAAAAAWFENRLNRSLELVNDHFSKYRISDALMELYRLIWEDFCSWYLEIIKPGYQQAADPLTYQQAISFFDRLMRMLHPFMPFITEEIWQFLMPRAEKESIMQASWPEAGEYSEELLRNFDFAREVVMQVRNFRKEKNISPKEELELQVRRQVHTELVPMFEPVVVRMGNLSKLYYQDEPFPAGQGFVVKSTEFYIPYESAIDAAEELARLESDLQYARGFLASVMAKLNNERFMQSAPIKVIENEQKKKADAEARIRVLEEKIKALRGE